MSDVLPWLVGYCPIHGAYERYGPFGSSGAKLDASQQLQRAGWENVRVDYPTHRAEKLEIHKTAVTVTT